MDDILKSKEVKPITPHAQRLLAASKREATAAKAKAKAKSEKKDNKEAPKAAKAKGVSKRDGGNEIPPTRSEYSQAKKQFMDESLCSK